MDAEDYNARAKFLAIMLKFQEFWSINGKVVVDHANNVMHYTKDTIDPWQVDIAIARIENWKPYTYFQSIKVTNCKSNGCWPEDVPLYETEDFVVIAGRGVMNELKLNDYAEKVPSEIRKQYKEALHKAY